MAQRRESSKSIRIEERKEKKLQNKQSSIKEKSIKVKRSLSNRMKAGDIRSLMKGCFEPKKEAKKGVDLEAEFRKQKVKGIKKALS